MRGPSLGYAIYMHSPEWRATRKLKLQQVGFRCQGCGSDERLQAHHLTYERFGHERMEDLQVLCHICHAAEHGMTPDVGPIAGPTTKQMSREIKLREMMEAQQGHVALAAFIGEQAEIVTAAMASLINADALDRRSYRRCRLIENQLGKLIDEVIATPVAEP
jgi:hypothetical protein